MLNANFYAIAWTDELIASDSLLDTLDELANPFDGFEPDLDLEEIDQ